MITHLSCDVAEMAVCHGHHALYYDSEGPQAGVLLPCSWHMGQCGGKAQGLTPASLGLLKPNSGIFFFFFWRDSIGVKVRVLMVAPSQATHGPLKHCWVWALSTEP